MVEHFERPEITYEACTPDVTVHFAWGTDIRGADALVALFQPDPESEWI